MLFLLLPLLFVPPSLSKKDQVGHVPMKGNLWRAKYAHEIVANVSFEFAEFARHCSYSQSEDTGITYFYSPNYTVYRKIEDDDSICAYSLGRHLSEDGMSSHSEEKHIMHFTLYFACDDTCCAMECCQRDIQMTILGLSLIGLSLLILFFYIFSYFVGLICAWRNGSLANRPVGRANQYIPEHSNTKKDEGEQC